MNIVLLKLGKALMTAVYTVMKLFPAKNKIVLLSRETDQPSVDFRMLEEELHRTYPQYKTVMLCRKIPNDFFGRVAYVFHMLTQMLQLATSKVAVLDSYCIPVSVLRHKKTLKVIQIWHAMGCLKKFGHSATGQTHGRDESIAKTMNMHKNYDCAMCSGPECVEPFAQAFSLDTSRIIPIGMPRIDYLTKEKYTEASRKMVYQIYPQLDNGKKNILYAPALRELEGKSEQYMEEAFDRVRRAIDYEKYNLIIKVRNGEERVFVDSGRQMSLGCSILGIDFIAVADFIVSDYSAIIFDAAVAEKPVGLYCFDWGTYIEDNDFYIDFESDVPFIRTKTAEAMMASIDNGEITVDEAERRFSERYVLRGDYSVTARLAEMCDALAQGRFDGVYTGSVFENGEWQSDNM